ncbi:uncharacterized protein EAE97_001178 [Botrytis byssoidea]|uniref:Cytochrome P450 n=1 Tax=Botrytis byssoidea TaxID=139641 RepID=A0A9P5IX31_9HELO|nr:uncharacterized protein EAE97_001178 [Botrytis byssoidea]KAF7953779.1 hypothetical protein EAE97_001178 [Botrytis byssoidea]
MTMDPLVIQTVAATQANKFRNAPSNRKPGGPLLGDGPFTTDGHIWKRSRELPQPVFSRSQISQLSGLESHLQRFLEQHAELPRPNSSQKTLTRAFNECLPGTSSKPKNGSSGYQHVLLKELVKKCPDDKTLIRNELMNVFFAARDSVGTVTSRMLFLLARSPEICGKLREEVAAIAPEQKLTFEFLKSLKYVQAVIDESDQIELKYDCMQKDKDIWGDDASEFNPDRMVRLEHSWKFIPFSGGRRTCPAQRNTYTDMTYSLVRMVQEFKTIHNRDDCLEYVMTKSSRNGVKVAFSVK